MIPEEYRAVIGRVEKRVNGCRAGGFTRQIVVSLLRCINRMDNQSRADAETINRLRRECNLLQEKFARWSA